MIETSPRNQIRNFLLVIGSSVGFAVIVVLVTLYYYGPTGRYLTRNVLLAPEVTGSMVFMDFNPQTGGMSRFVFDRIEFVTDRTIPVNMDSYREIFRLIGNDRSLRDVPDDVINLFNHENPSRLILTIRTPDQGAVKIFQEVHFAKIGDYYRIELHVEKGEGDWAYFYHSKIDDKINQLVQ